MIHPVLSYQPCDVVQQVDFVAFLNGQPGRYIGLDPFSPDFSQASLR
jgi:hypothetical protein